MPALIDQVVKNVEGKVFCDANLPTALAAAKKHAGKEGYVASMPQLLRGRVLAPFDNEIWTNGYTANSEENAGKSPQGNDVYIAVHGGGILGSPERIKAAYKEGLTDKYAAKFTDKELQDLLNGNLPDGTKIPVYTFNDLKSGNIPKSLKQYAVVMDFEQAKKAVSGQEDFDRLKDDPLVIVRAGGVEEAAAYLNKAKEKHKTAKYGSRHLFDGIDPSQAQGRLLFLGNYAYLGLNGNYNLSNLGRFVGVAPEAREAKKVVAPTLEQVLAVSSRHSPEINRAQLTRELSALYK